MSYGNPKPLPDFLQILGNMGMWSIYPNDDLLLGGLSSHLLGYTVCILHHNNSVMKKINKPLSQFPLEIPTDTINDLGKITELQITSKWILAFYVTFSLNFFTSHWQFFLTGHCTCGASALCLFTGSSPLTSLDFFSLILIFYIFLTQRNELFHFWLGFLQTQWWSHLSLWILPKYFPK